MNIEISLNQLQFFFVEEDPNRVFVFYQGNLTLLNIIALLNVFAKLFTHHFESRVGDLEIC